VVVTANHWWMDGIVAAAILGASYAVDRVVRQRLTAWRPAPARTASAPVDVSIGG